MMRFSTLLKHPADWMTGAAKGTGVVLTSRVRLARNLRLEPFPGWSTKERRVSVLERVKPEVEALPEMKDGFSEQLDGLSSLQKQVLVERHLISREQAARGEGSAAIVNRKQALCLMINEEDHLRMQAIRPGVLAVTTWLNASSENSPSGLMRSIDMWLPPGFSLWEPPALAPGKGIDTSIANGA